MIKDCQDCIYYKTMFCPNSSKCYLTEDKPYFRNKESMGKKDKKDKPVRLMIKDGLIACCSQMCTDECPNYNTCIVINTTTKKFLQMMLNSYYGKNGENVISSTDEIDKIMQVKTDLK